MTNTQCHYESLKVTRDAPLEVIRAAYRSLSQKHHPDKHSGDGDAAQVMARLNAAYSVLSDAEQRRLYDMQILQDQLAHDPFDQADPVSDASDPAAQNAKAVTASLLQRLRGHAGGKDRRIAAVIGGGLVVMVLLVSWSVRSEHESMVLMEQATLQASRTAIPAPPVALPAPEAAASKAVAVPKPAETAKAPAAPPAAPALKQSEFERLSAMLKSMGLGLHKLEQPKQAPEAKPVAEAKPANPEKAERAEKAEKAEKPALAKATPAPAKASAAAKPAAAPEPHQPREEAERAGTAELARVDAKPSAEPSRTPAAPAAPAAPRQVAVPDIRSCAPAYPVNAYRNGESGTVQLALLVGGDGRVVESKVQKSSGSAELDKAARRALSKCTFKGGGDKQAEPVWTRLDYVFSLD